MKISFVIVAFVFLSITTFGQKAEDVLATATGHTFKLRDLSPETQKNVADFPVNLGRGRVAVLDQMVSQRVYEAEAKSRGTTLGKLITDIKAKVPDPTDAEIKTVIDANQEKLAGLAADDVRKRVIAFLRTLRPVKD
jgi:hypothetical protein